MRETLNSPSIKAGSPPGTLIHVGEAPQEKTQIAIVDYNSENLEELPVSSTDEILPYKEKQSITWVNVDGLSNVGIIESIGQNFDIHPLVLEDILNTHQRPKYEEYDGYIYMVLKALSVNEDGRSVNYEQVSILVLDNIIFTFKESHNDIFQSLRKRIVNSKGKLRRQGIDY